MGKHLVRHMELWASGIASEIDFWDDWLTACTVSISSATAQAGLVVSTLSATTLTVTHPSVSGATLYWNCPAN